MLFFFLQRCPFYLFSQLAVANNRIITLQEDVERVKEESSYQMESRKVNKALSHKSGDSPGALGWILHKRLKLFHETI